VEKDWTYEFKVWHWIVERESDPEIRQRANDAITWLADPDPPTSKQRSELNNLAFG
jgi:hypothetical protein